MGQDEKTTMHKYLSRTCAHKFDTVCLRIFIQTYTRSGLEVEEKRDVKSAGSKGKIGFYVRAHISSHIWPVCACFLLLPQKIQMHFTTLLFVF